MHGDGLDGPTEHLYFSDDSRLFAEMLRDQWSLGPGEAPVVEYKPESYFIQSRIGSIYVYQLSMPLSISTVDYRTMQRLGYVSMRLSTRDRERHYVWGQELMRILLANRRSPVLREWGYTFYEITSVKQTPDLSGWYTSTIDVRLVCYNRPIRSDGFGPYACRPCLADGPRDEPLDPGACPRGWTGGCADDGIGDPGECDRGWTGGSVPDEEDDPGNCDPGWTGGQAPDEDDDPGTCEKGWTGGSADDATDDPGDCEGVWTGGSAPDEGDDPCPRSRDPDLARVAPAVLGAAGRVVAPAHGEAARVAGRLHPRRAGGVAHQDVGLGQGHHALAERLHLGRRQPLACGPRVHERAHRADTVRRHPLQVACHQSYLLGLHLVASYDTPSRAS